MAAHGVSVIGQWHDGVFTTAKGPDTRIEAGAILVIVGVQSRLEKVERMAMPIRRQGPIILAGYGAVGRKVIEMLRDAGETCTIIDQNEDAGVDVVGNVLDRLTLEKAAVQAASAIILALGDDSEAMFATAVVRELVRLLPTEHTDSPCAY